MVGLLVLGGSSFATYRLVSNKNNKSAQTSEDGVDQVVAGIFKDQQEKLDSLAKGVASVGDLTKLDDEVIGKVGLNIVKQAVSDNDLVRANTFIDFLTARKDQSGLDAAVICYQIATNDSKKQQCVDVMNEIARTLEIIKPDQTLPKSYYDSSEAEQG